MNRQTVIIIITPAGPECWGNLKKACEAKGWKYNTLSKKELPSNINNQSDEVVVDGCKLYRVPFK